MKMTNRNWLPIYCNPTAYLPKIQETRSHFSKPPLLFSDFIGKALSFLKSDEAKKMGFIYDPKHVLPCKWKCADESVFGMDLAISAYTGQFPFDKGQIGGTFNEGSIAAAVHHGKINIDFGGSHVGYVPGDEGGMFGKIWRPLYGEYSTDCGHLMKRIMPFKEIYEDACKNIKIFNPGSGKLVLSIPNEFVQPNWSSNDIKLMIDTDTLTEGDVPYRQDESYTHTPIGKSLFYLKPDFLEKQTLEQAKLFQSTEPVAIGRALTHKYFHIFDINAEVDEIGLPKDRLNLYMKYILSAKNSPYALKAAIIKTNLEYNKLTDANRLPEYKPYSFASFAGVIIDLFDEALGNYVNLYQPLGLCIKPAGTNRVIELSPEEIHHTFDKLAPTKPIYPIQQIIEGNQGEKILEKFTFKPGQFKRLVL